MKNENVEKKLVPWYESTSEYCPAKEEGVNRTMRPTNARCLMDHGGIVK